MDGIENLLNLLIDSYKKSSKDKIRQDNFNLVSMKIPVGISGRHIHLSTKAKDQLFGSGYELTPIKNLSQPGQYASKELLTLCGPKGVIEKVRIIGPCRDNTQVEILQSDAFKLGISPVIRMSGDLSNTPGIIIVGPKGNVILEEGVIVAKRHIHMNLEQAKHLNLRNGDVVSISSSGDRGGILKNVIVRADENGFLDCHIDMEEANALGLTNSSSVTIIK